jgi:hypothetical protein
MREVNREPRLNITREEVTNYSLSEYVVDIGLFISNRRSELEYLDIWIDPQKPTSKRLSTK